ncbi:Uma2 family endonuclease [Siccirubricoccus sp. KC 17139]|uniref:Uma2 family endonuclease n=1 Tax=Siccirubricoccus soli TaxID=2899147 RepID=A0ABT1DAA5_9PROT|nr:Uma2 family endonuclease [Siccirubricoccus soli]MCO6418865.1 Uma2 family endonuclease [Siccirubricoccus soli]MCP2685000.1 Uma2 family endonuclease [Siccirubricoccus soli]
MNALPQPVPEPMTAEEFLAWAAEHEARAELAGGRVIAMAPERYIHARTKGQVFRALEDAIRAAGLPCEALVDGMSVQVDAATVYEPDALVRCGGPLPPDLLAVPDPLILVEVVSPSSSRIDSTEKLGDYFRIPSVRHYLVVRAAARMVVHHARDQAGGIATRLLSQGRLTLNPPGLTLAMADLFPPA